MDEQQLWFQSYLEGYDSQWLSEYKSADGQMRYTNLPPGRYRFFVKARNQYPFWSPAVSSAEIIILRPWWQRWWAFTIYALALLLLLQIFRNSQKRELLYERSLAEQQEKVNHRLRAIDQLKDEILANTSHELRTPLNGMIGLAEALLEGSAGRLNQRMIDDLVMIVNSGRRLSHLVNDVQDFSKLKNKSLELSCGAIDLVALSNVALTLCQTLAHEKQITLKNEIPKDLAPVEGDENRMQQILYNLISNAIKFTNEGHVTIGARQEQEHVVVWVADTGIGIPAEMLGEIFESFEQVDSGMTRSFGGTGLGLAITKNLVELHGGRIWVTSELNAGSCFYFTLPISMGSPESSKPSQQDVSRQYKLVADDEPLAIACDSGFHVLVVDDEPINRKVLANHLELEGYRITQAADGIQALDILKKVRFDLVLLDIMMPKMTGYQVCQKLRQTYSIHELPVIFLSAKNEISDIVLGFEFSANDYLIKPISRNELVSRVKVHLQLLDINRHLEKKVFERTQSLNERNQELETLDSIVRTINEEIDRLRLLQTLIEEGLKLFPQFSSAAILLEEERSFAVVASIGFQHLIKQPVHGNTISNLDLFEMSPGVRLSRYPKSSFLDEGATPYAILIADLEMSGQFCGYLIFESYQEDGDFQETELKRLLRFREHAISALEKVDILDTLKRKNKELIETQQQLVMQEKMSSIGIITSGIAHEIRNPLNFINNFSKIQVQLLEELGLEVEELRKDPEKADWAVIVQDMKDLAESARSIYQQGMKADRIVDTIVQLPRHSAEQPRKVVDVDLNLLAIQTAKQLLEDFQEHHVLKKVRFIANPEKGLPFAEVVPPDFVFILKQLFANALEAVAEVSSPDFQPELGFSSELKDDVLFLHISDNGHGIPEHYVSQIFTPFFTTKPADSGHVGLSLFMAYDILSNSYRGSLRFTRVDEQTVFTIELPMKPKLETA